MSDILTGRKQKTEAVRADRDRLPARLPALPLVAKPGFEWVVLKRPAQCE
jgi:hypothetical protein